MFPDMNFSLPLLQLVARPNVQQRYHEKSNRAGHKDYVQHHRLPLATLVPRRPARARTAGLISQDTIPA